MLGILLLFETAAWPQNYRESAFEEPMQFFSASAGNSIEATWIAAVGRVDSKTPDRFRAFVEREGIEGGKIVLHSPGGNLAAGLRLGRLFREYGLATAVGKTIPDPELLNSHIEKMVEGICASGANPTFGARA